MKTQSRRIGILGGSFDPPTLAHEKVGRIFKDALCLDEVRYVPALQNPLKSRLSIDASHRVNMVKIMAKNHDCFSVSDVEIQPDYIQGDCGKLIKDTELNPSFAYETLKIFQLCEPTSKFIFLGGSDILTNFYKWHKAEAFINEFEIAIAIRPPHTKSTTISPIEERHRKNITIIERESMPDISSTDVRTFLSSGESDKAKTLLDQEVFDYIVANNLY